MSEAIDSHRVLKARYVFPVAAPLIPDGTVTVNDGRIAAVAADPGGRDVEDLGNVALIPGLVNAHTHLDLSGADEPLGRPGMGLVDWIRLAMRFRQSDTTARPVERGLQECRRWGTTTVADMAQPDWPVEQVERAGLDTTVFLELIAPTPSRVASAVQLADEHTAAGYAATWRPGLAPHAPYTVHPELLAAAVSLSAARRVPLAFHLAESAEEMELLSSGSGPFRTFLEELDAWHPDLVAPGTRPLDYLRTLAGAHRTLIVHGNYLDDDEIALLGQHAERMAVVYCPRTHARFAHRPYPLEKMLASGVTVALGTDSRASAPDLNLLAEMRFLAQRYPAVGRDTILELGTIRAARALGRDRQVGSLQPGMSANLAVVALPDGEADDPHDLLFDSHEPIVQTLHGGSTVWQIAP